MPFSDFTVFWSAAQAMLYGRDPYSLPGVYYPLPTFFLFLPLAALPLSVAEVVWTVVELLVLVAVLRRRALLVLLFMPVFLSLLMGQTVIPLLAAFALLRSGVEEGVALALLLLKPQLVALVAPWKICQWWKTDRTQIVRFLVVSAALAAGAFVMQPDWVARWLTVSGERMRAAISPSVWGVLSFLPRPLWLVSAGLVTLVVVVFALRARNVDLVLAASMLVNPVLISYDQALFTPMVGGVRTWVLLTLLSWVAFGISALQLNERAAILTTIAVIVLLTRHNQH